MARTRFPTRGAQKPETPSPVIAPTVNRDRGRPLKTRQKALKHEDLKLSTRQSVSITRLPILERQVKQKHVTPTLAKRKPVKNKSVLKIKLPTSAGRNNNSPTILKSKKRALKRLSSRSTRTSSALVKSKVAPKTEVQKKTQSSVTTKTKSITTTRKSVTEQNKSVPPKSKPVTPKRDSKPGPSNPVLKPKSVSKMKTPRKATKSRKLTLSLSFSLNSLLLQHANQYQIRITLRRNADAEAKAEALKKQKADEGTLEQEGGAALALPLPPASTIDDMEASEEAVMESGLEVRNARALESDTQVSFEADEEEEEEKTMDMTNTEDAETQVISDQGRKVYDSDEQDDSVGDDDEALDNSANQNSQMQIEPVVIIDLEEEDVEEGQDELPDADEKEDFGGEANQNEGDDEDDYIEDDGVSFHGVDEDIMEVETESVHDDADTTTDDVEELERINGGRHDDSGDADEEEEVSVINVVVNSEDDEAISTTSDDPVPFIDFGKQIRNALSAKQSAKK